MTNDFLPHQTPLQSSQAPQTLSQEVRTTVMGRNTKVLRKLQGMLRKERRATLSAIGPFGFRGLLASKMQV